MAKQDKEPKLVTVRFLRSLPPYNPGDIAGFEEHIAQRFIEKEIAVVERKAPKRPPSNKMESGRAVK